MIALQKSASALPPLYRALSEGELWFFMVFADPENYDRLRAAMDELRAYRIAVPRFDPAALARGPAVHFRGQAPGGKGSAWT